MLCGREGGAGLALVNTCFVSAASLHPLVLENHYLHSTLSREAARVFTTCSSSSPTDPPRVVSAKT